MKLVAFTAGFIAKLVFWSFMAFWASVSIITLVAFVANELRA